jgi:hypothetical protein
MTVISAALPADRVSSRRSRLSAFFEKAQELSAQKLHARRPAGLAKYAIRSAAIAEKDRSHMQDRPPDTYPDFPLSEGNDRRASDMEIFYRKNMKMSRYSLGFTSLKAISDNR